MKSRNLLVLAVVLLILILVLPSWPYMGSMGMGWYPSGGLGLVLLVILLLIVLDKI